MNVYKVRIRIRGENEFGEIYTTAENGRAAILKVINTIPEETDIQEIDCYTLLNAAILE